MTLEITLPAELEERLKKQAERMRLTPDVLTVKLLDQHLPCSEGNPAVAMLQQWVLEDEAMTAQEREANVAVLRALDEDRLSDRKLFPQLAKDKSA